MEFFLQILDAEWRIRAAKEAFCRAGNLPTVSKAQAQSSPREISTLKPDETGRGLEFIVFMLQIS